ncbi:hypothetical protein GOV04_04410 [Candidatus Woesearchaeota archaeon]|nr:hypothetical protein [Candidatus Woesearchaeota archaeon]
MATLLYLTYLSIIIIVGIIATIIASKIKIPEVIVLIFAGMVIGNITVNGAPLIGFPLEFITALSLLALVIIVFDASSRLKLKEFDDFSLRVVKLTIAFIVLTIAFLSVSTYYLFNISNVFYTLIFASLMAGTSPDTVLSMFKEGTNKCVELLKIESIINTPFIVLLPFLLIDLMQDIVSPTFSTLVDGLAPFLLQIVVGIGAGVLVGIVALKLMKKTYSERLSPLMLIAVALITYILAENLNGSGVLAVTTTGLMFGSVYVREKAQLQEFSQLFSSFLEIMVFVLIGLLIKIPFEIMFYLKSALLFLIFLLIRFIAVNISLTAGQYNFKERLFISLNTSKGIAVAVVVSILTTYMLPGFDTISNLMLVFLIYSLVISAIVLHYSKFFIRASVAKKPEKLIK